MATVKGAAAAATATNAGGDDAIQGVMNVSKEDQDKINRFAKLNARLEDIKDEANAKKTELKNYEDAQEEVELAALEDDETRRKPCLQAGDIIVELSMEKTQQWLETKMDAMKKSILDLEKREAGIVQEMSELKAYLYAKFGKNIHLESGP